MSETNPWATVQAALKEPFNPKTLSWRKQGGADLAYLNARDVMKRLDDVVGIENWQDRYEECSGRIICYISIRVEGEWVTKSDGSGDTKIEGDKGGISGAFKRSAVRWGVGRYLYYLKGASANNLPSWAVPK
tara:strand:- start:196 stop:591 length:396 start_codon:yes stop_codon:yes gene_type:complete